MDLLIQIILLLVGFFILTKGADVFVDGSSALASKLGVPSIIIGLTIVAMGTSAPELAVSTVAAIKGSNEIAFSNISGSNIFNLLVVLGVCALIHNVPVDTVIMKRDYPLNLAITFLLLAYTGFDAIISGNIINKSMSDYVGILSRFMGISFLIIFVIYIISLIRNSIKNKETSENEGKNNNMSYLKCFIFIVIGLACIIGGGELVVNCAKAIAKHLGMSDTLIGLTIVSIGTSLPELVTSVVAARKNETSLAIGNVVGSNIFNILLILGVSSAIHPIGIVLASVYDLILLIVVSIITYIFMKKDMLLTRKEGTVMILMYIGIMIFAIVR